MDNYQIYEEDCKRVRQANNDLLNSFESWLELSGLGNKTIKNHRSNVDFYINEYLLYEDIVEVKDGIHRIDMFLGDWFVRKAMWASPASIKSNAASIKKFYKFLSTKGLVSNEDIGFLEETIKEEMPTWLVRSSRYL